MTSSDNDRPNTFWVPSRVYPQNTAPVQDVFERVMERVRLHLKTHKQGKVLYWINGRFWIRCYTHKRLEPATWLV